jgi:hypothetical protein
MLHSPRLPLLTDGKNENAAPQGRPLFGRDHKGIMTERSNRGGARAKIICAAAAPAQAANCGPKALMRLNQSKALFGPRAMARYESWGKDPTEGAADSCARFNE